MSLRCRVATVSMALLALAACGGSPAGGASTAPGAGRATAVPAPPPSATASPGCTAPAPAPPTGTIGAAFGTALSFAPDGRLFYAERAGTIRVWQGGGAHLFASVPSVTTERDGGYSERGLLGLAVSAGFAYAFYSDADYAHQRVVRWKECAGVASEATTIITLPAGSDCCHKGGRLAMGPDDKLYVTLGEQHVAAAAQDTTDVRGKILRYNPDGSIPSDNPFGPGNPVWAFGFRNPFGIALSADGRLAVTSNGPTGDAGSPATGYDTAVVSVMRGAGYQWPRCYGYGHPLASSSCGSGQPGPDWSSESGTAVPTGATFVDASGPSPAAGHLVFCSLNRGMLILTPAGLHTTVASGPSSCRLDVKQALDHSLYFSDEAHIYKLG